MKGNGHATVLRTTDVRTDGGAGRALDEGHLLSMALGAGITDNGLGILDPLKQAGINKPVFDPLLPGGRFVARKPRLIEVGACPDPS